MKYFQPYFRSSLLVFFISFLVLTFVFISCGKKEWTYPSHSEGLRPAPNSPWLPSKTYDYACVDNDLVTLGRVLFYDKNLSFDRSVSCGSCHQQANGFADTKQFSTGNNGSLTTRNAHAIMNYANSRFWDGKTSDYLQAVAVPLHSHLELNMPDENVLCNRLSGLSYYPYLFKKVHSYYSTDITLLNIELALASFMSNITAPNCKYDLAFPSAQSGLQPTASFTQQELNGMTIFNGKGKCNLCHGAANGFSGNTNQFEDIGLDTIYTDLGRGAVTNLSSDNGRFHVPSLKNISLTAPYMHDGRFKTLNEVVDFFNVGVKNSPNLSSALTSHPTSNPGGSYSTGGTAAPLMLTASEKSDLISFLYTLTDQTQATDIRYSDPFKH
jgi:cytochrome c peroxidase